MLPTTEILLQNGRFIRRITQSVDLGSQESVLSTFAEQVPIFIRNTRIIGRPMHLLACKNTVVAISELDKLPFNSNWSYNPEKGYMVPCYNNQVYGSVVINDHWIAPANFGKLIFAVLFNIQTGGFVQYVNTYLFQYRNGELYQFPYPNLYENSRLCMGREFDREMLNMGRDNDVTSILMHAQTSFYETTLNSDLVRTNTPHLFRRDIDGKWIYPTTSSDHYSSVVSAAFMTGFTL